MTQPGVVAVHDQLAFLVTIVLCLDLRKPCVLRSECGRGIRFGEV